MSAARRRNAAITRSAAAPAGESVGGLAADPSRRLWTAAVLALFALYAVVFGLTALPSLASADSARPILRIEWLAQCLLLIEQLTAMWLGDPAEFALADRGPTALAAIAISTSAAAAGWLALRVLRADRGLSRCEQGVFSLAVGYSALSLSTLAIGLAGGLHERRLFAALVGAPIVAAATAIVVTRRGRTPTDGDDAAKGALPPRQSLPLSRHWLWCAAPFVAVILLGGMLPPIEFDVREYHLQAPKEFFLAGRIEFLPHNVYANMALGSEMLSLLAMALLGDWQAGALVGKTLAAAAAPITALALWSAGQRQFGQTAGVVAALAYISIPWVIQVSTLGLVEGFSGLYLFLAVYAVILWRDASGPDRVARLLLAGFLAGSAVAVKYPAALFVALPLGLYIGASSLRQRGGAAASRRVAGAAANLALFGAAAAIACGLWFAKNAALTGNPVYPLLYEWFAGATRTAAKDAQWRRAHSPHGFGPATVADALARVFYRSEWLSPLVAPLAIAALALSLRPVRPPLRAKETRGEDSSAPPLPPGEGRGEGSLPLGEVRAAHTSPRPLIWTLAGYLAFILLGWWLLTHRIDRFWIPALPIAALLAGVGFLELDRRVDRRALLAAFCLGMFANLVFAVSPAGGDNAYFVSLERLRNDPVRTNPWHLYLNEHAPPESAVLLVGDAQPFDLRPRTLYSTAFDDNVWEEIARGRTPAEIRASLRALGVSYIYVDWGEIARYRSPGNYGYTDFVQPRQFRDLVAAGALAGPLPPIEGRAGELYRVP